MRDTTRRRSPQWVRAFSDKSLHGLANKMMRQQVSEDLSAAQEWLWAAVVSELEYRWRSTRPVWKRCACMLCIPPFPDQP